jgi:hypothetical protein
VVFAAAPREVKMRAAMGGSHAGAAWHGRKAIEGEMILWAKQPDDGPFSGPQRKSVAVPGANP